MLDLLLLRRVDRPRIPPALLWRMRMKGLKCFAVPIGIKPTPSAVVTLTVPVETMLTVLTGSGASYSHDVTSTIRVPGTLRRLLLLGPPIRWALPLRLRRPSPVDIPPTNRRQSLPGNPPTHPPRSQPTHPLPPTIWRTLSFAGTIGKTSTNIAPSAALWVAMTSAQEV